MLVKYLYFAVFETEILQNLNHLNDIFFNNL